MRSFDPRRVGALECEAWVTYYRHDWVALLRAAVGLTRATFRLPWPATLYGAWLVLRANQLWAPYPDNDPAGAPRCLSSSSIESVDNVWAWRARLQRRPQRRGS